MGAEDYVKKYSVFTKSREYSAEEAHADAMSRGAKCRQCPLFGSKNGPIKGEIRPGAQLTIVGEAPGRVEVETGTVFAWKSGAVLENALAEGGLRREDCTIVNVLECRPPKDIDLSDLVAKIRKKKKGASNDEAQTQTEQLDPITACHQRLVHDIEASRSDFVLAVGGKALETVAKMNGLPYADKKAPRRGKPFVATIMNQHGAPVVHTREDGSTVHILSALHPAFAMREHRYVNEVKKDITRAAKIAVRGKVAWEEPEGVTFPYFGEVLEHLKLLRLSPRLSIDIETDGVDSLRCRIRCIGIGGQIPGHPQYSDKPFIVTFPYRWCDGRAFWPDSYAVRVRDGIRELLDAVPLVAHNAPFDVMVLQREGFLSRDAILSSSKMRKHDDTLLMDKNSVNNGMPHGLGAVAKRYYEVRLWKYDADVKDADGMTDDKTLHEYNVYDIAATHALSKDLENAVSSAGGNQSYEIDKTLSVIAREMNRMGVPIDEAKRGQYSRLYNKESRRLKHLLTEAVGFDLNPRSPPKMRKWLYQDLGLIPALNSKNKPWKDGDDPGTGVPALFALRPQLDERINRQLKASGRSQLTPEEILKTDQHKVNLVMGFRTCETIRGRYIDKLKCHYSDADRDLSEFGEVEAVNVHTFEDVFLESLPKRPRYSVAHPIWNVGTIPTGRWSSKPNFQNAPSRAWAIDTDEADDAKIWEYDWMQLQFMQTTPAWHKAISIRSLFTAVPGHVLVGADFDQVELRLFAILSEDEMLIDAYANGVDMHTWNLASLMSSNVDEIKKLYEQYKAVKDSGSPDAKANLKYQRTCAKMFVFSLLYDAHVNTIFGSMSSNRDKSTNKPTFPKLKKELCQIWYDRWHKLHPETHRFHNQCTSFLRRHGYVEDALHHRKRYYPDNESMDSSHINHVVQGHAGAMANNGVIRICEAIPFQCWSAWTGLMLQVHDQLVVQVPIQYAEEARQIVQEAMYHEFKGMKFKASAVISTDAAKQDV